MTTLTGTTLLTYPDGRAEIYAVWADAIGQYAAIHDTDGRPVIVPEGVTAPHLTPDQLAAALTPPRHPAYDLADKGAASRPELAERMAKAAALVEAGGVRLTGPETAVVNEYTVTAGASAYAVQLRRHGLRVNVEMGRSAALTQALGTDTAYAAENALQRDLDATQDAASGRYGY